tara:strand:+ start:2995 stop:3210 length:216 start_codon:yes stop_codon:yes gene_type:complete
MNKIYFIRDKKGNKIPTHNKTWCYQTLGTAKTAAKNIVRQRNKRKSREEKLKFADIKVIECEITKTEEHPI